MLPNRDNKVCVVSIIGKSRNSAFTSKASAFNPLLDKDVFKGIPDLQEFIGKGMVECYYDVDSQVIYLHVRGLHDAHRLASLCQRLSREESQEVFLSLWQKEEYSHAKTLLWMFTVSHIIVLSHPGSSFDISYVRLFRTLDTIRLKLQHSVTEQLHGEQISKDWYHSARPCAPRVLFVFESSSLEVNIDEGDSGAITKSRTQKSNPLKRVQHAIEDQIYRILRKSRVITNISNNSLFAVPANQEFVYIHSKKSEFMDPAYYYLQQLKLNSSISKDSDSPRSRSYQTNRRTNVGVGSSEGQRSLSSTTRSIGENSFKEFLWQHIDIALGRGFDDNVGRNPVPAIFEAPTCDTWFSVSLKLYNIFFGDTVDGKSQAHLNTLKSLLETDIRFSENRCIKVLPVAESAYQEGLPTHYVTNFHLTKLAQARRVFSQFARGPACEKYMRQLEEACEKFWKNGRQLCEEISLSGNHCVNPLHRLPNEPENDLNCHLPIMPHSSAVKTKAACNCGRKQGDKDDPFDHRAANYEYYESMEKVCCNKLVHIDLPVFKPSTTEVKAGHVLPLSSLKSTVKVGQKDVLTSKGDIVSGLASLSLALSLGQSGGSDYLSHVSTGCPSPTTDHNTDLHNDHGSNMDVTSDPQNDHTALDHHTSDPNTDHASSPHTQTHTDHTSDHHTGYSANTDPSSDHQDQEDTTITQDDLTEQDVDNKDNKTLIHITDLNSTVRQHSTTEYLPGMIHSDSPIGLLPEFPSWSVCCLGKGTLYSHTQGLDLPGFLHGSNFLLPWDITIKAEKDKWPSVGEMASRKSKQKKASKDVSELNLRAYLGDEYECPRGHRFFCSGPEKVIKVSSTSTVKDNANKLVTLDMPLYCPCTHCRSSKGMHMAQLIRLYVVTPDGPVSIMLNPFIQPSPPPCPLFSPGTENPIELQPGGLWVMRLPYIYLGDQGPYTMPVEPQHFQHCHMLKGVYSYKVTSQTDT